MTSLFPLHIGDATPFWRSSKTTNQPIQAGRLPCCRYPISTNQPTRSCSTLRICCFNQPTNQPDVLDPAGMPKKLRFNQPVSNQPFFHPEVSLLLYLRDPLRTGRILKDVYIPQALLRPSSRLLWPNNRLLWPSNRLLWHNNRLLWSNNRVLRPNNRVLWPNNRFVGHDHRLLWPTSPSLWPNNPLLWPNNPLLWPNNRLLWSNNRLLWPNNRLLWPNNRLLAHYNRLLGHCNRLLGHNNRV